MRKIAVIISLIFMMLTPVRVQASDTTSDTQTTEAGEISDTEADDEKNSEESAPTEEESLEDLTVQFNGSVQILYAVKMNDGSYDIWGSIPGVIVNNNTVIGCDITSLDYSGIEADRAPGYEAIGMGSFNPQLYVAMGRDNVIEVSESQIYSVENYQLMILKTADSITDAAPVLSPGNELNDEIVYTTGYSPETMSKEEYIENKDILIQPVRVTLSEGMITTFSDNSQSYTKSSALINDYGEIFGLVIDKENGIAISLDGLKTIFDENGINFVEGEVIVPIDRERLHSATDAAQKINTNTEYTEDSKEKFDTAYENAKKVLTDENAGQNEIDLAAEELEYALDNLTVKPEEFPYALVTIFVCVFIIVIIAAIIAIKMVNDKDYIYKLLKIKKKNEASPVKVVDNGIFEANPAIYQEKKNPVQASAPNPAPAVSQPVMSPASQNKQPAYPQQTYLPAPQNIQQTPSPVVQNTAVTVTATTGHDEVKNTPEEPQLPIPARPTIQHYHRSDSILNSSDAEQMGIKQPEVENSNTPYLIRKSTGERIHLTKNHFVIGRIKKCDYSIEDDSISKEHCRIFEIGGVYHLTDMNSTNGTFINGDEVPRQMPTILSNGSEIMISKETFVFFNPRSTGPSQTEKEMASEPDTNVLSVTGTPVSEPATGILRAPTKKPYLMFRGKKIEIDHTPFVLGRSIYADLQVSKDINVSREHAVITEESPNIFTIYDNDTPNGTILNGQLIESKSKFVLKDGATIGIVGEKLTFHMGE